MVRKILILSTIFTLLQAFGNELNTVCIEPFHRLNSGAQTQLVPVNSPADATNLIQTGYGYSLVDPIFSQRMGNAIEKVVNELRIAEQKREKFNFERVRKLMDSIASARNEIALAKKQAGGIRFGLSLPETHTELEDFCRKTGDSIPLLEAGYILDRIDREGEGELDRNRKLYSLAEHAINERPTDQPYQIEMGGKKRDLTALVETEPGTIVAVHPSFKDMIELRAEGFKILEATLNDQSLNELELLDSLSQSYAFLMQAPPYYRGSPSIVEGFIDAVLRARLNKTLPLKTSEPFWDVIFNFKGSEPYTAHDFLKNYRN